MGFLLRVLANALAIFLAAAIVPGIEIRGVLAALGAGLVLGLVNAVVRPVLLVTHGRGAGRANRGSRPPARCRAGLPPA